MADVVGLDDARLRTGQAKKPGHYYLPSKNEQTEQVSFRAPCSVLRAIDELVASKTTPFLTRSDVGRQGFYEVLNVILDDSSGKVREAVQVALQKAETESHLAMYAMQEGILKDCEEATKKAQQWGTQHLAELLIRAAVEQVTIPAIKDRLRHMLGSL